MSYSLPLFIASDHAGYELKNLLIKNRASLNWKDVGSFSNKRTDYPDWAGRLCKKIQPQTYGVLVCGTGQGMSMTANTFTHVRAALCWDKEIAKLARAHNNANILCLPGRFLSLKKSLQILDIFLSTKFDNNLVYTKRVANIKGKNK